jgi:hypothetical protein
MSQKNMDFLNSGEPTERKDQNMIDQFQPTSPKRRAIDPLRHGLRPYHRLPHIVLFQSLLALRSRILTLLAYWNFHHWIKNSHLKALGHIFL